MFKLHELFSSDWILLKQSYYSFEKKINPSVSAQPNILTFFNMTLHSGASIQPLDWSRKERRPVLACEAMYCLQILTLETPVSSGQPCCGFVCLFICFYILFLCFSCGNGEDVRKRRADLQNGLPKDVLKCFFLHSCQCPTAKDHQEELDKVGFIDLLQ